MLSRERGQKIRIALGYYSNFSIIEQEQQGVYNHLYYEKPKKKLKIILFSLRERRRKCLVIFWPILEINLVFMHYYIGENYSYQHKKMGNRTISIAYYKHVLCHFFIYSSKALRMTASCALVAVDFGSAFVTDPFLIPEIIPCPTPHRIPLTA